MLWAAFLGLFLVCAGMSLVFLVYLCLLWYSSTRNAPGPAQEKPARGLSASDLQRLPGAGYGAAVAGTECAVCLDDIEAGQQTRVLPACHHTFHLPCADAWLATRPACPICRASLAVPPPPLLPQPAM